MKITLDCDIKAHRVIEMKYKIRYDKDGEYEGHDVISLEPRVYLNIGKCQWFYWKEGKWRDCHEPTGRNEKIEEVSPLEFLVITGRTIEESFKEVWEQVCGGEGYTKIQCGAKIERTEDNKV